MTDLRQPKYRRQKGARGKPDRAFVEWHGQRIYLGVHGTPKSRTAYGRIISEWRAAGGTLPVDAEQITVAELAVRFWRHAKSYYRKRDGTPTSTLSDFRVALRPLSRIYGDEPAAEFGPMALRTVRQTWLDADLSRKTISCHRSRGANATPPNERSVVIPSCCRNSQYMERNGHPRASNI